MKTLWEPGRALFYYFKRILHKIKVFFILLNLIFLYFIITNKLPERKEER
jgi:hypothetical protein